MGYYGPSVSSVLHELRAVDRNNRLFVKNENSCRIGLPAQNVIFYPYRNLYKFASSLVT